MKCRHCHKEGAAVRGGRNRECLSCHRERIKVGRTWIPPRLRKAVVVGTDS